MQTRLRLDIVERENREIPERERERAFERERKRVNIGGGEEESKGKYNIILLLSKFKALGYI